MDQIDDVLLNVADIAVGSYTNGPGKRLVVWVQGCTINCKGCFNKKLQPHIAKHLVGPVKFANEIVQLCKKYDCEGVTLSGGEPFQQSRALIKFAEIIKKNNLTVVCFSGYNSTTLLNSKDDSVKSFLNNIDLLIAGPFNSENKDYKTTWFDDPNKDVIYLSSAYNPKDFYFEEHCEFIVGSDFIQITGYPDEVHIIQL